MLRRLWSEQVTNEELQRKVETIRKTIRKKKIWEIMRKDGLEILTPTRGRKQCLYNFVQTEVRTSTTMWKRGCKPAENNYKKGRCRKAWEAV